MIDIDLDFKINHNIYQFFFLLSSHAQKFLPMPNSVYEFKLST